MTTRSILQSSRDLIFRSLYGQNGHSVRKVGCDFTSARCHGTIIDNPIYASVKKFSTVVFQNVNEKLNVIALLFAKQCNAIAAQRVRRAMQIIGLYHKLGYDKQTIKRVVENLGSNFLRMKTDKPLYFLVGACLFNWEKERITDNEIKEYASEIDKLYQRNNPSCKATLPRDSLGDHWEKVIDRDNLVLWRKPIDKSYLYEYKVFGTFYDIPARAFFNIQTDLDYRKQWDKLIVKLQVVDREMSTGCEVIQWIMHYPFPMYSREYVFLRKCVVDHEKRMMVMMSRATEHPGCPHQDNYVRVSTYRSHMVIKPHSTFDENGFDYVLTYFDDPQAAIPSPAYNWMASTGVPDFVDKMHVAARNLHEAKYSNNDNRNTIAM